MPTKKEMYSRTTAKKGFLQHLRLPFNSPTHIKGICAGASRVWLEHQFYHKNDIAFWDKYSNPFTRLYPMVNEQDNPRKNSNLTLTDFGTAFAPNPVLWTHAGHSPLKFYTCSFQKPGAHAMAGYIPANVAKGSIFDPNIGQFDIGSKYYMSMEQLWTDLWSYYDFSMVMIYDVKGVEVEVDTFD